MSYTAEIDKVDEYDWHHQLRQFDDANIFQTWSYGAARWGERNLSHMVIRNGGEVVGLAQTSVVQAPLLGGVLAYVTFGPVWQRHNASTDFGHYKAIIGALTEEYVDRRGLCLRLRSWPYDMTDDCRQVILAERNWDEIRSHYETFVVDLSLPLATWTENGVQTSGEQNRITYMCRRNAAKMRSEYFPG